ncbi:MAG TPA: ABC transporter substrate-binding protein [Lacipirellulaceae bacterium]|nr:ABC transporter substrate-binding protein [Lacipirellulaceae bacterium]
MPRSAEVVAALAVGITMSNKRLWTPAITRRSVLRSSGALTVALVAPQIAYAQSKRLVSTIFGGKFEEIYRRAVIEPFTKKTGVEVVLKYGSGSQWLTSAVVNKDNPEIDLLWLAYPESVRAITEDLCDELSPTDIPNLKDVAPIWYEGYRRKGVGFDYASFGIAYRTDMLKEAPTSWKDLWDPKFKGKLALPDITASGGYETLVLAATLNGGSATKIDPGFAALKKLRPSVRKFYKSNPEATQLLERGEVAVCPWFNGRAWSLADTGSPVSWVTPKEGALVGMVSYHIPKGAKDKAVCKALINQAISVESQEAFCNEMQYGPVNVKAKLTGKAAERTPPLDRLTLTDWFAVSPNIGPWLDRWNREVVG